MELGKPRELRATSEKPLFIQTDACYDSMEDGVMAGIGAVPLQPCRASSQVFLTQVDAISYELLESVIQKDGHL